ncbi:DJ-1/PfpI family protein [Stigmatella erecta]|uniref:DJ-1/PfpI family protein n=1 Tax=Stigmatella erecta TaxID=83460 RepID=A0A1I0IWW6_9BACT|nr:DJ-1/PfpI family protein [Stigmatella erecta]SEU01811.1 DJ-1/PfpI family protein [Stigmatella erecta]
MLAQIVLFDGFDMLDAIAPYEVLWAGGAASGGALQVEFATLEGPREVPSGPAGVKVSASATVDPRRAHLLVVPGVAGPMQGDGPGTTTSLLKRALETRLPSVFRAALDTPGVTVATVCGGSLLLAMAGLLAGRHAVTHSAAMPALAAAGAIAIPARVVDDGNLVTSGGVTSGLDLGLHLVERELGPRIAHALEALFEHERRGTVWRAQGPAPLPI